MKRAPDFSSMNKAIDGGEDILGERIHEVADHLLIPSDPTNVGRFGNRDLLLFRILNIEHHGWSHIGSLEETHNSGTAKHGQNLGLPGEEVFAGNLDSWGDTDSTHTRGGRGRRHRRV
jgi:hypothetical protein